MIKANELRIGNYFCLNTIDENCQPVKIFTQANSMFIRDCEHYGEKWTGEPIPLTEDILLRLGFTDKGSNRFSFDRLDVYTKNASDAYEVQLWNFDGNISWVQYVHELQNIVFALTGTELTLNQ